MIPVNILVEGPSDEAVAKQLLKHVGLEAGPVYGRKGKAHLLERLPNYNQAAQFAPWFAIIDLDTKPCPPEALQIWLPQPSRGMRFRIAVRAIESWLLADSGNLAHYLSVPEAKIQTLTDSYPNPKEVLISIARHSRNRIIRSDMVPHQSSGAKVGPLYVDRLKEFTEKYWDLVAASKHSKSLQHCINALETLVEWE